MLTNTSLNKTGGDMAQRCAFIKLTETERRILAEAWRLVEVELDSVLDVFYRHLQATPEMATMLAAHAKGGIERLKAAQREHWARLFQGKFDEDYARGVRRIGEAHARIGLDPRWYLGGYAMVLSDMCRIFGEHARWSGRRAAVLMAASIKAVFIDMDLALAVYFEAANRRAAQARAEIAQRLEMEMAQPISSVAAASTELSAQADTLSAISNRSAERSMTAAAATEQISANIGTVASAAEELSASIGEITRQVNESARQASRAAERAGAADRTIAALAESAAKIDAVVRLISDVAGQTNLLALNATIEAARAGDAGKGFAVVASEVKRLATQTAKATEDIAALVAAIQGETRNAVEAIRGIVGVVGEVERAVTAIAASVEEQGAATKEIARSVQEAARGTTAAAESVSGVQATTREADAAVQSLRAAAAELARSSEVLRTGMSSFLQRIREAA